MRLSLNCILFFATAAAAYAQESPYLVTYTHGMAEPHHFEISLAPVTAAPKEGNRFTGTTLELEFAPKTWWTSALYLDGQSTANESSLFTGYRIENRFRLWKDEHAINPVLYIEFANTTGADKVLREFVGFDSWRDLTEPNAEARRDKEREIETKLILSGDHRGWNFSGNLIAEKNLAGRPWEFGYAAGASKPLALASAHDCRFCRQNFSAGLEAYGGLGEQHRVTLANTSHYLAPCLSWALPRGVTLRVSPAFGLTSSSNKFLMRFGISYEIPLTGR